MENSTFVISARIPTDTAKRLKERLKTEEMTMSEFLQRYAIGTADGGSADFRNLNIAEGIQLANGGSIPTPKPSELPEEAKAMLSAIGGLASGAIVYQTLTTFLPNSMDKDEKESYAIVGALSTGIISAIGIHNVLGKKKKGRETPAE